MALPSPKHNDRSTCVHTTCQASIIFHAGRDEWLHITTMSTRCVPSSITSPRAAAPPPTSTPRYLTTIPQQQGGRP
jgi:hypothetical protein